MSPEQSHLAPWQALGLALEHGHGVPLVAAQTARVPRRGLARPVATLLYLLVLLSFASLSRPCRGRAC